MTKKKATPKPEVKELTKVERFYIENNYKKSLTTLASDLGRDSSEISAYYGEVVSKKMEEDRLTAGKLMARDETHGVTIMTKEASILGDEKVRNAKSKSAQKKQPHIHKIYPK